MRFPARFIDNNLIWSEDGGVWAMWRIQPVAYPFLARAEKLRVFHALRGVLAGLPPEAMLLSVCRQIDPYAVIDRMISGIDIDRHPAWRDAALRTLDDLEGDEIYDRYYFAALKLPDEGLQRKMASAFGAAAAGFWSSFGLTPSPPTRGDLDRRRRQAAQFEAEMSTGLSLRPARPAEIRWLYARSVYRSLEEPFLDDDWTPDTIETGTSPDAELRGPSLVHLVDAVFKEGGDRSDQDRPRHSRYLRINTEAGTSYQTFMVMAGMPRQWDFPGGAGEWFIAADQAPFPVDWCARVTSIPNSDAQLKSRRQARQLTAQVAEYDGEPSGPPAALAEALEAVDAQRSELSGSPSTPELRVSMVFGLASWSLAGLEEQAGMVRAMFEAWEYEMPRPTGNQSQLFRAMLPAAANPQALRDYAQFLLPSALASGMPIGGTRVGDPTGMVLARTLDGGTHQPVLFDPAFGPKHNRSASIGMFGSLGSGKSYAIKQISWATLARGGRIVALDRTVSGEYVKFAAVAPGRSQVVELSENATITIDPLRMFTNDTDRVRYATGFLSLLTGTSPTDLDGAILADAVRSVAAQPGGRLIDIVEVLDEMGTDSTEASTLSRKIANYARSDLAQLAFGDGTPLTLEADYIVLWTPGLRLPTREQVLNEHLAKQLLPEQVFSQACLYLVAAIGRDVTFRDGRFAAIKIDEGWSLTASPQGRELLLEGTRDGRKHNAAVWFMSQHPDDIGDDKLAELMGVRMVFRQGRGSALKALAYLGMEATDHLVDLVETGLEPGQCLLRDARDRIGRIEVLPAATPELQAAFNTNPSDSERTTDDDYRSGAEIPDALVAYQDRD